jgi:hypothetical protein
MQGGGIYNKKFMKQRIVNRNEVLQGPSPKVLEALKTFKTEHASLYLEDYYHSILLTRRALSLHI